MEKLKMNNVDQLIAIAQERLRQSPIDTAHGLAHHQNVHNNCLEIIKSEGLNVDLDVIRIAAWWHDVESQVGDTNILRIEMEKLGFPTDQVERVLQIISEHSFGNSQSSIEAKVLYDADKIEYFNPERIQQAIDDNLNGDMTDATLKKHCLSWIKRSDHVLSNFHFEYSRIIATRNFIETKQLIDSIVLSKGVIDE